jgi:hypothetical protein
MLITPRVFERKKNPEHLRKSVAQRLLFKSGLNRVSLKNGSKIVSAIKSF